MLKAHQIRLNPTPEQANYFVRAAGTARFAYNWAVATWRSTEGKKPTALELKKQFNAIKGEQFPWVYTVTKCACEGAFMDFGTALTNYFDGMKKGRHVGVPQFKKKGKAKLSFYLANDKFTVDAHWIKVPKLGCVNMAEVLRFEGAIQSARISNRADWWFVSITVEVKNSPSSECDGVAVGIDVGLNRLATLSDGTGFENQKPLKRLLNQVRRYNRRLSRRQPGSHNREKARRKLTRLHYRIANLREDALQKATTEIARRYAVVCLEDLNIEGMLKNHRLARSLSDAALGRFNTLLEAKVKQAGGELARVDRFFPSSKRCSQCHYVKDALSLSERIFVCPQCGLEIDRDWNASLNLLQEGLRLLNARHGSGFDGR